MFALPAWLIPSFLRPTMDFEVGGIDDLLLKRDGKNSTDKFLYYFLTEAAQAKEDPSKEVLERFIVDKIDLDQCIRPPQHEYLTIDALDTRNNGNKKKFILERMLAAEPNPTPNAANIDIDSNAANLDLNINIDPDRNLPFFSKIYDKIKDIADCVVATLTAMTSNSDLASDQLSSMEEGTLPSLPLPSVASECLSMTDSVTVSVSESAESVSDAVSDSLDKSKTTADDRFLGEWFTTSGQWRGEGENLESFSPERLTLFELVCIAYVVHKLYPNYTKLGTNCYFYAGLVSAVAKRFGGVRPGTTTVNHLAQHGRWNGVKITRVKQHHVDRVLAEFKNLKSTQLGVVSLSSFKLLSLTNTFYIGQPSFLSEFKVYSYGRHRT